MTLVVALPFAVISGEVLYYFERDNALNPTIPTQSEQSMHEPARLWAESLCQQFRGHSTYYLPQGTFAFIAVLGGLGEVDPRHWYTYTAIQSLSIPHEDRLLLNGACAGVEQYDWKGYEYLNTLVDRS